MGVSENGGTPKSSILIGFSILNRPFWGTPIFGNTHIIIKVLNILVIMSYIYLNWWRNTALDGAWLLSEPKRKLRPRGAECRRNTRENGMEQTRHFKPKKYKNRSGKPKTDHGWSWRIQPCWQSSRCILGAMSQKITRVSHHSTSCYPTWLCTMAYDHVMIMSWSCMIMSSRHLEMPCWLPLLPNWTWTQGATCLLQILACCHQRLVNKRTSLSRAKTHASSALQ